MDQLQPIEIFDSVRNNKIRVYVSIEVASRCKSDKNFAQDLYKQLLDQNIEEGSVLEIDTVETTNTEYAENNTTHGEEKCENNNAEIESSESDYSKNSESSSSQNSDPCEDDQKDLWSRSQTIKFLKAYQVCRKRKKYETDKEFWSAVARELVKHGISKHYSKCSNKFKQMLRSYKALSNKTDASVSNTKFEFFNEMKDITNDSAIKNFPYSKDVNMEDGDSKITQKKTHESEQRGNWWLESDILKLISIYKKNKHCFGKKSNRDICKLLSTELAKQGVKKDEEQCRKKWHSLKKSFENAKSDPTRNFGFMEAMRDALDNGDETMDEDDNEDGEVVSFDKANIENTENKKKEATENVNKQSVSSDHNYSWKYNETSALIVAYNQHKDKFENRINAPKEVWEEIAAELSERNILKSAKNCELKWKSLYNIYNSQKESKINTDMFVYFKAIDKMFQVQDEAMEDVVHEDSCKCSQKRQIDKQKRHVERMDMLKRKLDLEERKITAFEEYMIQLKSKLINGRRTE